MTTGWVCQEYRYQESEGVWGCDCEIHKFFCVSCGTVEESADGKVYFYTNDQGEMQFVCYVCVRGPNPKYVRTDSSGKPLPIPKELTSR
jgi:hypothetical protein